ncbi:uracil-DNA glycosylase [Candidatus Poribacteria bacterium]|nr:uracil-DNA glycosylase [Candidatus Poribacteria bacterium]
MTVKMEAIKAAAIGCTACGLSETRKNVVFGSGDPTSKLVVVAEGPSAMDDRTTLPFSGPTGELLDDVLEANKLTRNEIWLTNVIKCRAAIRSGRVIKNRPPKASEIKACAKWLDGELTLISPAVILCMGSPAAKTLIHKGFRITQERGIWFTETSYAPFVMATFNPAFVLRMEGEDFTRGRQILIDDIAEAQRKSAEAPESSQLTLF